MPLSLLNEVSKFLFHVYWVNADQVAILINEMVKYCQFHKIQSNAYSDCIDL